MDYDATLDEINELTEKSGVTLDKNQRATLQSIIAGWEANRPIMVDYPDGKTLYVVKVMWTRWIKI